VLRGLAHKDVRARSIPTHPEIFYSGTQISRREEGTAVVNGSREGQVGPVWIRSRMYSGVPRRASLRIPEALAGITRASTPFPLRSLSQGWFVSKAPSLNKGSESP
jgi:hypothetical protein